MTTGAAERRSYGQYCGLARALDLIGDRWTLLIIRELLVGPRRFQELQAGLPGIATNLLTQRLRQLEQDGLVLRQLGQQPKAGTTYALTTFGLGLRPVTDALLRWSSPTMVSGRGDDAFRPDWLAFSLPALLRGRPKVPTRVGLEVCGQHLVVEAALDGVHVTLGQSEGLDASLRGQPEIILALAAGVLDFDSAIQFGATTTGSKEALHRVFGPSGASLHPGVTPRRRKLGPRRRGQ
ncbi:MAG: winged helix-turn-helix transcriptional regulator [Myxococcaceae bacterium]